MRGEPIRVVLAFDDRDRQRQARAAAFEIEANAVADGPAVQVDLKLTAVLHGLAVEPEHDVAHLRPGLRGRPVGIDVAEHDAGVAPQLKSLGQQRRDGLRPHADLSTPHAPELPDLLEHAPHDVARRGKPQPLVAARLRQDQRVDADNLSLQIDQRPAAVARIDRRIGLQVDHRIFALELPRDGADHAERDRAGETQRAAKRHDDLPGLHRVGVRKGQRRQVLLRHLDDRQIGFFVERHQLRAHQSRPWPHQRSARHSRIAHRQLHLDAVRALHDVRVGDDVAAGVDDDPGAGATRRRDKHAHARRRPGPLWRTPASAPGPPTGRRVRPAAPAAGWRRAGRPARSLARPSAVEADLSARTQPRFDPAARAPTTRGAISARRRLGGTTRMAICTRGMTSTWTTT